MKSAKEISIKLDKGEVLDKAQLEASAFLLGLCEKYSLNYYELIGLLDVIRQNAHESARGDGA